MSKPATKFGGAFLGFPRWVLPYLKNDSTAKAVLLELLVYMKPETQTTTTSYKYIAEQVGVDRRTVIRAVNRLVATGVLIRRHRGTNNRSMSNAFVINFNNPEALGVVSPMTLGSDTHDTISGDTHDTPLVTRVTPNKELSNKSINKSSHTKRQKSDYDDLEVDERIK